MPTQSQRYGRARGRSVAELTFTSGDVRGPAVVLLWRTDSPWVVAAKGPFRSKAAARAWGREHAPRRHVVVGLHGLG